jgi:hypothetical protein
MVEGNESNGRSEKKIDVTREIDNDPPGSELVIEVIAIQGTMIPSLSANMNSIATKIPVKSQKIKCQALKS